DGTDQLINNSSFTYWLYNSEIVFYLPFLLLPFIFKGYKKGIQFETLLFLMWFIVPFTLFQFFISNPGTHIQNYFIPLIVLSSLGMVYAHDSISINRRILADIYKSFWLLFFLVMAYTQLYAFVPGFNNGYPWKDSQRGPIFIEALEKTKNQYFIYGFPYNRGWREVRSYFEANGMPRSFYTNDNVTIGEYYLYGVPAHKVHSQQMPQYYIYVQDNQEGNEISGNSWLQMYEEVGFNHPTTKILKLRDN
ncbi:MAG: hypothetical protein KC414_14985, partial [Romboutsia sp.]|nr:hypothetical protein [Romboutsia sp.]